MPHFNSDYAGKPFRFIYGLRDGMTRRNQIVKFDRTTSQVQHWTVASEDRVVFWQPAFVPKPNSESEDDGVLLVAGSDLLSNKTYVFVLDAAEMSPLAIVEHPHRSGYALHNYFWFRDQIKSGASAQSTTKFLVLVIIFFLYDM